MVPLSSFSFFCRRIFREQGGWNSQIPKLLPADVKIAHKTGSITGVQHDAAILELPNGNRYVLVILSKNLADVAAGKETIAQISRLVFEYVSGKPDER